MRIAIDLQGMQSLGSRQRGIGRYSYEIISHILDYHNYNQYFLFANASLLDISSDFLNYTNKENITYINWYSPTPLDFISQKENISSIARYLRSYAFRRVLPDVVLITSFFEGFADNSFTEFDKDILGSPIVSIFYDLIPLINPKLYLNSNPTFSKYYFQKIDKVKELDALLCISLSSAQEAIRYLGFDKDKLYNISSACNNDLFNNNKIESNHLSKVNLEALDKYILYTGASDPRKNVKGLLKAYSQLPLDLILSHKLVFAGNLYDLEIQQIHDWINEFNINSSNIVLLGYVSDQDLVCLYQNCKLFVFPSFHEGFGLPLLEAMSCGAPAIGSDRTSIPEVIGDSKAMFNPNDTSNMSDLIEKALTDQSFKSFLEENSKSQVKKFSWQISSGLVIDALKEVIARFPTDHSSLSWDEIITLNNNLYYLLLDKINNNSFASLDENLVYQIASSIDLINSQTDLASRSLINSEQCISWRVEGPFDSNYSLAILNRYFIEALAKINNDVSIHITEGPGDYSPDMNFLKKFPFIYQLYNKSLNTNKIPTITSRNLFPPRVSGLHSRINLLHSYGWEESEFPREWVNNFNSSLQGISVMSNQVKKILIDNGVRIPIIVCGLGVDHLENSEIQDNYFIKAKKFKFLHVSSCFPRKGIDVLLKAYGNAFNSNDDVSLIIKTFNNIHNNVESILEEERLKNSNYPDVVIIKEDLSNDKLKALYRASNALVAPSRGEGFGLPISEAMKLGLPVITTGWGGHMDFCNPSNCWLIDYKFSAAKTHFGLSMSYWAEPSSRHLSELLKRLFCLPNQDIRTRTLLAKKQINKFTWENMALSNVSFSKDILKSKFKINTKIGWVTTWNTRCGIASYSKHLIDNMNSKVTIFSAFNSHNDKLSESSIPCWHTDENGLQDLNILFNNIIKEKITSLVIQFNYGLFDFKEFECFLDKILSSKITIILFIHSTKNPKNQNLKSLENLVSSFSKCQRLLVHTIDDLNNLKSLGLVDNVSIFPHGIGEFDINIQSSNNSFFKRILRKRYKLSVATYGFCLPNKGFDQLIKAVRILADKDFKIELNLFTALYNDYYKYVYEDLKVLVSELRISDLVNINVDYATEESIVKSLGDHDLIVFPYQFSTESSSASVRQAISSLKPILVTPNPIFNDISPCLNFLPGYDSEDIAQGIVSWFENSKNKKEDIDIYNNKLKFIQNFGFSKLGFRLDDLICALEINK